MRGQQPQKRFYTLTKIVNDRADRSSVLLLSRYTSPTPPITAHTPARQRISYQGFPSDDHLTSDLLNLQQEFTSGPLYHYQQQQRGRPAQSYTSLLPRYQTKDPERAIPAIRYNIAASGLPDTINTSNCASWNPYPVAAVRRGRR